VKRRDLHEAERMIPLSKRIIAEFIGTFVLVFAAVGADAANMISGDELGKLAVLTAPGLALAAMIYSLDKVSGAYFNPAISIGFVITGHLRKQDLPYYIGVQVLAAIVASIAVTAITGPLPKAEVGLTVPHTGWEGSFLAEVIFTFMLMFAAVSLKEDIGYRAFGGIAIGSLIVALGIIGSPISGGSMNPARSFGPALVAFNLTENWIYWLAPIIGSIIGIFVFRLIKENRNDLSQSDHVRDL